MGLWEPRGRYFGPRWSIASRFKTIQHLFILFIYALNWISAAVEEWFAFLPGTWKATDLMQSWPKAAGSAVGTGSGDRETVAPHTGALTGCGLRRLCCCALLPPGLEPLWVAVLGEWPQSQLVTLTCLSAERKAF